MFEPPSSKSEAIEKILRQRCGAEFPGVTWEEMNAAVAASSMSEEESNFECDEGADKIVSKAVQFRKTHRQKLNNYPDNLMLNLAEEERLIYTAFLGNHDETVLQEFAFFNRAESDAIFDHWLKLPYWSAEEAVSLLFGKEPTRVNKESLERVDGFSSFVTNYHQRLEQVVRAIDAGLMPGQITPKSLILWAAQTGIECPAGLTVLVKSSSPATQETAPENGGLGFASLKNLNWEDITLTLLSGGHIEISARDLKKKAPLGCLGLMNRTTNKPNKLFTLLIAFAESRRGTLKINSKPKDQASDLRKELKAVFSITTNPIPVVDKCWAPRFNLVDKRDAPDKRAKEKASRSTEPFDEHKLSHQRGDSLQGETNSNLGFGPDDDGYTYDEKEDDMAEDEASGWIAKHDG